MARDILSAIRAGMHEFSKGQKLIARFMTESYDKAAFMTASRLGKAVGVSESTVVRFAVELGYDGYPAMQKALQEMIRGKLTSVQRIEVSDDRIGEHDVLAAVLQSDIEKIRMTLEGTDRTAFHASVDAIIKARRVYILGVRSAGSIASFLAFYFRLILDQVMPVQTSSSSELFEQLLHVGPEDVVIGVSFPRYSRGTVKAMQFARDRGAVTIAVTDGPASPLAEPAVYLLMAKSDMASFADSLVAPLSLVNALITAVGRKKKDEVSAAFQTLEHIWEEYEVYEQMEQGTV